MCRIKIGSVASTVKNGASHFEIERSCPGWVGEIRVLSFSILSLYKILLFLSRSKNHNQEGWNDTKATDCARFLRTLKVNGSFTISALKSTVGKHSEGIFLTKPF